MSGYRSAMSEIDRLTAEFDSSSGSNNYKTKSSTKTDFNTSRTDKFNISNYSKTKSSIRSRDSSPNRIRNSPLKRQQQEQLPSSSLNNSTSYYTYATTSPSKSPMRSLNDSYRSFHTTATGTGAANHSTYSSTSVVAAFRELQEKSKAIEIERADALRLRDELRQQLSDKRRANSVWRSKVEIDATENLLSIRSSNDKVKLEYGLLDEKLASLESINRSTERGLLAQKQHYTNLSEELFTIKSAIYTKERQLLLLNNELKHINERTQSVRLSSSPELKNSDHVRLETMKTSLEQQLYTIKNSRYRNESKAIALQKYLDLVLKVNEELCETLIQRERSKSNLLKLTKSYSPQPRYSWPKEVPYSSILHVIKDAATATATAAVENTARKATEHVIKDLIEVISPSKQFNHKKQGRRVHNPPVDVKRRATSMKSSKNRRQDSRMKARRKANSGVLVYDSDSDSNSSYDRQDYNYENIDTTRIIRNGGYLTNKKSQAREAAVSSATRLAAATAAAESVLNTPGRSRTPPVERNSSLSRYGRFVESVNKSFDHTNSRNRSQSTGRNNSRTVRYSSSNSVDGSMKEKKSAFIPTGRQSHEFNVVASVSKASRAARQLNATIASK